MRVATADAVVADSGAQVVAVAAAAATSDSIRYVKWRPRPTRDDVAPPGADTATPAQAPQQGPPESVVRVASPKPKQRAAARPVPARDAARDVVADEVAAFRQAAVALVLERGIDAARRSLDELARLLEQG